MMINKKRYIPPYIEIVEEDPDYVLSGGIPIGSVENVDEERQSKGSHFFDDDDTSPDSHWDSEEPSGWDI